MKKIYSILLVLIALLTPCAAHSGESIGSGVANYGFYVGVGGSFPLGSLRDNFGGAAAFQFGLTGGWHDVVVKADVAFAQPSFRNDNIYSAPSDAEGHPLQGNSNSSATHLAVGVQAGYTVARLGRLAITPCAGVAYNRYGWDLANYQWGKDSEGHDQRITTSVQDTRLGSWGWTASVDFDFTLHRRINTGSLLFGNKRAERLSSSLRITPWVSHASFKSVPSVSGCQVGFTVAYRGLATLLE